MNMESVHLLLVEDNSRYLAELIEWLHDFGFVNIKTATNSEDALKLLNEPFDIIISDMRMESDDSGFLVINEVKLRSLSSVVIILTANDTVLDCREAFKAGAWDYISKTTKGNVFEILDSSIREAITYFNRWGNHKNESWASDNMAHLEEKYFGKYVAIFNGAVIEVASSLNDLEQQIDERQLRRFLTTIKKIGDFERVIDLLKQEENSRLEFKSSFQWDYRLNKQNEDLKNSVLKTIVGFLNSNGGTLLIGVDDSKGVLGIGQDIELLSKKTRDQFEQTLLQTIDNRIGGLFIDSVSIRYEMIGDAEVCAVDVKKSSKPAFLKGQKGVEFYLRHGNLTKPVNVPDIYNYF